VQYGLIIFPLHNFEIVNCYSTVKNSHELFGACVQDPTSQGILLANSELFELMDLLRRPLSFTKQIGRNITEALSCFGGISMRTKQSAQTVEKCGEDLSIIQGVKRFSYKELKLATKDFHPDNKIGAGGFGTVYKGILKDGTLVAVKKLSAESSQGVREFLTEIAVISDIEYENLVQLQGCCVEENQRILVYAYLENNSISQALLGSDKTAINLGWPTRSKICIGTARGLAYLHETVKPPIVHRDIKASNILLDKHFNPKIADFGLAKLFPDNITHISTRVAGTIGYLAPEYAMRGQLTKKADVYSFGVLMLEIISGRSNKDSSLPGEQQFILETTWQLHEENRLLEIVDPRLRGDYPEEDVLRFIHIALFCTQAAAQSRPTMTQVVAMLSGETRFDLKELSRPGFISDLAELKIRGTRRSPRPSFTTLQHEGPSSSCSTVTTATNMFSSSRVS